MNAKILALLLCVVLTGASGAAQAQHGYTFDASREAVAKVQSNPVLPPAPQRGNVRGTALTQVAATIASWKNTFKTMFDPRIVAQRCLATAVYFEARSESHLGQLAVATVILNRAKASNYPSSICGVVYQGAHRLNACQFSFACDGQSDLPQDGRAWETALSIAALALAKDRQLWIVAAATHYHADYVDPYWSKSLHRVTKIGRHIFYSQG
ncbi:MAG: cell wall hydrolase [Aestuariivirga sp.]